MSKVIRALVTGGGSGVGQGILKSLRLSALKPEIICSDISPVYPGLYRADKGIVLPKVESENALVAYIEAIRSNQIDLVFIGSEFDLSFFSEHKNEIEKHTGAIVVASPPETVKIAEDKWLTAEFLRTSGLPFAESFLPENLEAAMEKSKDWGYPLVLKTRKGTSSRHVHVIRAEAELRALFPQTPFPMLQKLIGMPSNSLADEYTCGIFKCSDGSLIGPFTARRTLRGGTSWVVEVDAFESLYSLLRSIADKLAILGPFNVQLMLGPDGPVPFEFNARYSGTTAIRAHFGFNDAEMAIRNLLLGEEVRTPLVRKGIVMRYIEEVFVDGVSFQELGAVIPQGQVNRWF